MGWARADLRLFGAERSPAGSGCDPAAPEPKPPEPVSDLEDTPPNL